ARACPDGLVGWPASQVRPKQLRHVRGQRLDLAAAALVAADRQGHRGETCFESEVGGRRDGQGPGAKARGAGRRGTTQSGRARRAGGEGGRGRGGAGGGKSFWRAWGGARGGVSSWGVSSRRAWRLWASASPISKGAPGFSATRRSLTSQLQNDFACER